MRPGPIRQALMGIIITAAIIITVVWGTLMVIATGRTAERLPKPTAIRLSPSSTVTRTPAATPTLVSTHILISPTSVPTAAPLASATVTHTPSATPTVADSVSVPPCQVVSGWQDYTIQPGDTLFLIGLRYGLTVTTLSNANCLTGTVIMAGDTLVVPPVTPISLADSRFFLTDDPPEPGTSLAPTATGTQTATDGACTNPDSVIIYPKVGAILTGKVAIKGTAIVPNFSFYKLEIRQEGTPQAYANLYTGTQEVIKDKLAYLDTSIWPDGEYWLRLVVVNADGNYPERCAILVTFDN